MRPKPRVMANCGGHLIRFPRIVLASVVVLVFAVAAWAQTRTLTIHTNHVGAAGAVRIVSGALGACNAGPCIYAVAAGATARLAADYPGRLSGGTGPAAGCGLSTCSFSMTADVEITATFTPSDGPVATLATSAVPSSPLLPAATFHLSRPPLPYATLSRTVWSALPSMSVARSAQFRQQLVQQRRRGARHATVTGRPSCRIACSPG